MWLSNNPQSLRRLQAPHHTGKHLCVILFTPGSPSLAAPANESFVSYENSLQLGYEQGLPLLSLNTGTKVSTDEGVYFTSTFHTIVNQQ